MSNYELQNIDPESIDVLLESVEKSFNIKFVGTELSHIKNFGELCDYITNKIPLQHCNDCTTQQAFYKIRNAIESSINETNIVPDTLLVNILPRNKRLSKIRKIENKLGFSLNILRPKHALTSILAMLFIISLFTFLINWEFAILGVTFSLIGFQILRKYGNEIDVKTVGELAKKITREHYLQSRRNPGTFNKNEIELVLTEWFCEDFDLDKCTISRNSKF